MVQRQLRGHVNKPRVDVEREGGSAGGEGGGGRYWRKDVLFGRPFAIRIWMGERCWDDAKAARLGLRGVESDSVVKITTNSVVLKTRTARFHEMG
jgi:hypothetical protein